MKTIGRNILFLAGLTLVITFLNACATVIPTPPPSTPPSDIAWLIGRWDGEWIVAGTTPIKSTMYFMYSQGRIRYEGYNQMTGHPGGSFTTAGVVEVSGNEITFENHVISGRGPKLHYIFVLSRIGDDRLEGRSSNNPQLRVWLSKFKSGRNE